jgi:hypothetical protein
MFEITPDQIKQLNDTQLRDLVALLCEAELRKQGLSSSAVTAGGNQTASDGGVDVRVNVPQGVAKQSGYIPRGLTVFQVKAEDIPRARIAEEMAPSGALRSVIKQLIAAGGAYVIVSSLGSVSDKPLRERKAAMREAVASVPGHEKLALDFFDRTRVASWVRDNPGLTAWVRQAVGQPLDGWLPYGNWGAAQSASANFRYVVDEHSRIRDMRAGNEGQLPIKLGIQRLRELLAKPGEIVRLVGLSGTGKTRLLAALFDEKVEGGTPLNKSLAHYTDAAVESNPAPRELITQLIANRHQAVVIVDNCPQSAHRLLAQACATNLFVSIITVEYDVREDAPEHTNVFLLEPSSDEVIRELIRQRFPVLAQPAAFKIADVSGGNARLALAIANSIKRGETLTGVQDSDLFERLFHQRDQAGEELIHAARVCALVYSFAVEDAPDQASELGVLAEIAGMTTDRLYAVVEELAERQLVQRRAHWRAVLPQALAAWLAKRALGSIPIPKIEQAFLAGGRGRLARSFTRRLGDLHDSSQAQSIAKRWLAKHGPLGNPGSLTSEGYQMLRNLAPVDLPETLAVLTRAVEQTELAASNSGLVVERLWLTELRALAYDAEMFTLVVNLMMRLCVAEKRNRSELHMLTELFQVCLSGTNAPLEARIAVVKTWFAAGEEAVDEIAIECLRLMLKTEGHASASFEFGARPRTYGYWPKTEPEVTQWYEAAIGFTARLATEPSRLQDRIKHLLAASFRELWRSDADVTSVIDRAMRDVLVAGYWPEGWTAVRNTLRSKQGTADGAKRLLLVLLEEHLRPRDTLSQARTYLRSKPWGALDVAGDWDSTGNDDIESSRLRADEKARELGKSLVADAVTFDAILDELVSSDAQRARQFGEGIGIATADLFGTWQRLVDAFDRHPAATRDESVLSGFLRSCGERDLAIQAHLLNEAVEHDVLASVYPLLQVFGADDEDALPRLLRSLGAKRAAAHAYRDVWAIRGDPELFCQVVLGVCELTDGMRIAIDVFSMRLHGLAHRGEPIANAFDVCARDLLSKLVFEGIEPNESSDLSRLIHRGFAGVLNSESALTFAMRLREAIVSHRVSASSFDGVFRSLVRVQPIIVLDVFFGRLFVPVSAFEILGSAKPRLLDSIPLDVIGGWCSMDPETRVPRVLTELTALRKAGDDDSLGCSPVFSLLLGLTKNRLAAFRAVEQQIVYFYMPTENVQRARVLVEHLARHDEGRDVRAWANEMLLQMDAAVANDRVAARRESARFE